MRAIIPPLLVLSIAVAALAIDMTARDACAAEPLLVLAPPAVATVDPVGAILKHFQPTAVFVGRTPAGMGYVLMSEKRGYFIRPQPGGIVRVIPAEPAAVKSLAKLAGWAL
ncbi:hypothetical protein ASG43_03410 [Aureimonas sp. Leaf454]|uniref:hypothetical protein n=1 Tax=Aureimonas sp. Leaf454 TaxID=1736381 RepID=UPI0006FC5D0C|nr:hypothetical protein [Aureimonas sp. Leaf454]KQT54648.1 hypothetical protein ASG43_03410 [Aureimonas sp. Leaf454]